MLNWLNGNEGVAQWLSAFLLLLTAGVGLWFSWKQTRINEKLGRIQDFVGVFAYVNGKDSQGRWFITITNVGSVPLYVKSYIVDKVEKIVPDALLPAGQQQTAWINFPLPLTTSGDKREITFLLIDSMDRTWRSKIESTFRGDYWETYTRTIERGE